jgi:hypothetical protein
MAARFQTWTDDLERLASIFPSAEAADVWRDALLTLIPPINLSFGRSDLQRVDESVWADGVNAAFDSQVPEIDIRNELLTVGHDMRL